MYNFTFHYVGGLEYVCNHVTKVKEIKSSTIVNELAGDEIYSHDFYIPGGFLILESENERHNISYDGLQTFKITKSC